MPPKKSIKDPKPVEIKRDESTAYPINHYLPSYPVYENSWASKFYPLAEKYHDVQITYEGPRAPCKTDTIRKYTKDYPDLVFEIDDIDDTDEDDEL